MTTDIPTKQQTIRFFAYGTLRKDERLHDWIEDEIISELGEATVPFARLYYGRTQDSFPYLVETNVPSDEAVGEVYELPLNENVMAMLMMEMNVGYRLIEVEANMTDGETRLVVLCAWDGVVGKAVPDNNWKSPQRMAFWQ
jgi:gamma-glutamylcyclotransferase (GGCT)/AIG2-like uncharacterized protein YtfP